MHYEAERIALGEECDFHFVADVLEAGIDQWNSAVQRLKTRLSKPETLCQELQNKPRRLEHNGGGPVHITCSKAADYLDEENHLKLYAAWQIELSVYSSLLPSPLERGNTKGRNGPGSSQKCIAPKLSYSPPMKHK